MQGDVSVWRANEGLWNAAERNCVVAKLIVLPAMLATAVRKLEQLGAASGSAWKAVMQATGIGWIRLDGAAHALRAGIAAMRTYAEANGGSLTVLRRPAGVDGLDCWGTAGDSISLMRAVKQQLDPKGTLNPGRFLGGI